MCHEMKKVEIVALERVKDQRLPGVWGKRRDNKLLEHRGFLGQKTISYNDIMLYT